jgi:tetratricopeptide (TPR) repeat protein
MTEYTDDYRSTDEKACIDRFQKMLRQGSPPYFDVHELEMITDYFLENLNHSMAKRAIEHGLDLHPHSHSLKLSAARVYAANGNLNFAMSLLKEVEKVEWQNEEVFLIKASIHAQLKEHGESIENLKRAVELSSELRDEILLDMAFEQQNQQDYTGAVDSLKKALDINPDNDSALHEIGFCFDALQKSADVIPYYEAFLDKHPYSYAAWYNLGNAFFKQGDYKNCIAAYGFCLAIEESFTPALYNKANALIQLERYDEAIIDFEESLQQEQPQASTHCYLGECYEKLEQVEQARLHYHKAITLDKNCSDAFIGLAVVCELEENWRESLKWYKKALQLDAHCSGYWHMYAMANHECNEIFEAEAAFLKSVGLDKTNVDAWEDYAVFKAEITGNQFAIKILQDSLILNPESAQLQYRLASYLCQSFRFAEANDLLSLALKNEPEGLEEFLDYYPQANQHRLLTCLTKLKINKKK